MLLLPGGPPSPNTSVPVVQGQEPLPFWMTDNVAAVLESGQLFLQSGRIARRSGTAEVRVGTPVTTLWTQEHGLVAHQHAVRRAEFPSPVTSILVGGLEGLIVATRAGVRELWFVDAHGSAKIPFPIADGRAAQFAAATSVTVPIWGQRDDSFFLTLDRLSPSEKTWVVTLKRGAAGAPVSRPITVKKIVELATLTTESPSWFVPDGTTPVVFVSGPYLDATNHLIICVGYQPGSGSDFFGFAAVLDLMSQTVLLTIPASIFGPPTFGGAGQRSFAALTLLHLDRATQTRSRLVAVVTGQGFDAEPFPGPFFHTSQSLSVIDGTGSIVLNGVSPFSEIGLIANPFFFNSLGTRRHIVWGRSTGPFSWQMSMTDVYSGETVDLGGTAIDDAGVLHPAVEPFVTFIRPDFAVRLAAAGTPYFVKWWDKRTGKILLSNPLTDTALQTEDADLKGKKRLKPLPPDVTGQTFAYHVVEQSRLFPYQADAKNPA